MDILEEYLRSDFYNKYSDTYYSDSILKNVFGKAITKGYITLKTDGTYEWNKTNRLLAYMCGRLYCGDRVREDTSDYTTKYKKGRGTLPAKELKKLFGVDVGKTRDNINVPGHYDIIDELFNN